MSWFSKPTGAVPDSEYVRSCDFCHSTPYVISEDGEYKVKCSCGKSTEKYSTASEAKNAWNNGWRYGA